MKQAGVDVVRHVWCAEYDPLTVCPSADAPGYVQIQPHGEGSLEFWGKFSLTMPVEMALALAEAIKACAEEQKDAA